jgi:hypothetical protein
MNERLKSLLAKILASIVGQQGKFGQHFPLANSMWLQLTDAQVNHDDRAINKVKDRRINMCNLPS